MLTKIKIPFLVVSLALFAFVIEREFPGDHSSGSVTYASISCLMTALLVWTGVIKH